MNLAPIFSASGAVQIHLATVFIALFLTFIILPMKKGTKLHKFLGRIWVICMLTTAIVTFAINSFDSPIGLSPIHLFSILVLFSVPFSIYSIRKGRVSAHKKAMMGVIIGGLGIAGAFTLSPGRLLWEVLFT
ncbi:MAG: DUF2306 domain-containing protein [Pikeienuella sp.]